MREHEIEPVPGLPERLPGGERIIWQGAPDRAALRRYGFHWRLFAAYFAVMIAWTVVVALTDRPDPSVAALGIGRAVALAGAALGLSALFAWMTARSTLYTVTDRRVVIRFGLALPMTVNLPYAQLEGVSSRANPDGSGDVVLQPARGQRIAYLVMWPHTRPWRFKRAEPMLRCVPDAARVARLVAQAFAAQAGAAMEAAPEPVLAGRAVSGSRPVAA